MLGKKLKCEEGGRRQRGPPLTDKEGDGEPEQHEEQGWEEERGG